MPKLSIITINYNNGKGLHKTIESVIGQSFTDYEYILIDGGSADESKQIIEKYKDRFVYWIAEKDNGIYDAMNKGIDKATGEYTMFLNSGDYLPDKNVLLEFSKVSTATTADIFYGNILLEDADNEIKDHEYPSALSLDFWKIYTINHQAAFIKRSLFTEIGKYDMAYALAADYAFFLKCFIYGKLFSHINKQLVYFKLDGVSGENKSQYQLQMQQAWNNITPGYLKLLYTEHHDFTLMLKHRIMILAKNLNRQYGRLKKTFR
ncbi:MAG: PGL/p-HBAD biosynthesis glycosyltransferase [Ferruginibacter sp.]|uniref:glycosyltransferase family 2 protein n=1 Tax=Ferruginibacter sp. TaxID=1940288 RepID=UPI0026595BFF|nr:glycosyltransferase family 2 protein [Ferruginibacter sp.]MDB5280352.1 PGL/p-HBAD biosynthesis glycosyltransferase [Ferruginibacter sp.]